MSLAVMNERRKRRSQVDTILKELELYLESASNHDALNLTEIPIVTNKCNLKNLLLKVKEARNTLKTI